MKIIVAGGGSGGHLTPLLAIASALKNIDKNIEVIHIGQKGDSLQSVTDHKNIDQTVAITAGKFRRYNGESFLQHITDFKTIALNIRDFFRFIAGTYQAWRSLGKIKPDAVFLKGGFVCVPVGYAARLRKIPYITHDSDAIPGLANRLTAKDAVYNTTALNPDQYPYKQSKTLQVGIPVRSEFRLVTEKDKQEAKVKLGYPVDSKLIFSVGGGLGALNLNKALAMAAVELLDDQECYIIHLSGRANYDQTLKFYQEFVGSSAKMKRVNVIDFSSQLFDLSAAADLVVTRAGATNIAEFAIQGKPCVVIPAPHLTGGQQLHNAKVLEGNKAAAIVQETHLNQLAQVIKDLLYDKTKLDNYSKSIRKIAVENSAEKIAQLLIDIAKTNKIA